MKQSEKKASFCQSASGSKVKRALPYQEVYLYRQRTENAETRILSSYMFISLIQCSRTKNMYIKNIYDILFLTKECGGCRSGCAKRRRAYSTMERSASGPPGPRCGSWLRNMYFPRRWAGNCCCSCVFSFNASLHSGARTRTGLVEV